MTDTTTSSGPPVAASTLYGRVGGDAWFEALTAAFYAAVADDPILRPLYPDDLAAATDRLCGFLSNTGEDRPTTALAAVIRD